MEAETSPLVPFFFVAGEAERFLLVLQQKPIWRCVRLVTGITALFCCCRVGISGSGIRSGLMAPDAKLFLVLLQQGLVF